MVISDETRDIGKGLLKHAEPFKATVRNLDFLLSAMERSIFSRGVIYYKPVVSKGM